MFCTVAIGGSGNIRAVITYIKYQCKPAAAAHRAGMPPSRKVAPPLWKGERLTWQET